VAEVNFLVKKGLTVPKGSASTPAIIFDASDPNTGIYSPAADQLAISTNGTGRLFVASDGKVGVGGAPSNTLHVQGDVSGGDLVYLNNTSAVTSDVLRLNTAGAGTGTYIIDAQSTGTSRFVVNGAGRVGIGTATPNAPLSVSDGTTEVITSPFSSVGSFGTRTNHPLALISSNVERLRITSDGKLGLGTSSPNTSALLDVTSTTLGFLPPRMTEVQRDAISSPAAGLMIYNTTTNKLNFYNGTAWEAVTSA